MNLRIPNQEGKKNGQATHYDNHGNLRRQEYFINDAPDGEAIEYYPNGNIKVKGSFKNGIANGVFTYYYASGDLERLITVMNGLKEGKTIFYDTLGFPKSILHYKKNKLSSQFIFDSLDNTKIRNIINFDENKTIIFNRNQTINIDNSKFISIANHKDSIVYGESYTSEFSLHIGKKYLNALIPKYPNGEIICWIRTPNNDATPLYTFKGTNFKCQIVIPVKKRGLHSFKVQIGYEIAGKIEGICGVETELYFYVK